MPNIKSAKTRVLITEKETLLNNDVKQSMKTAIKKVKKAATKEEAAALQLNANKRIDIAASKGVIKANTRDRYKTRLNKIVNSK
ncbi:MAG: 30S ribosomal protein S20 [bacterium]|nr:30S ribosomal protein S20 [bacterium]